MTSNDFDNDPVTATVTLTITDGDNPTIDAEKSSVALKKRIRLMAHHRCKVVSQTETITLPTKVTML
ncbi:hypothetical protein OK016_01195 [Vibrio chagasii]|nr:hypothetical protein [Vibrio chagasii]